MSAKLQPHARSGHGEILALEPGAPDCKPYVQVPFDLYKDDDRWIPPFRSGIEAQLERSYPWYQVGTACHFVIPGVGRASAYCKAGSETGYVGSFECANDEAAAFGLLDRAVGWLRGKGATRIRGPVTFDTWHPYRFVVEGGDRPPFLLEPYNKSYYPILWERYGFKPVASYFSSIIEELPKSVETLQPHHERTLRKGIRFRTLDLARFDDEIALMHRMSNQIFEGALGFQPISLEGFRRLYAGTRPLLEPGLTVVASDASGQPIGYLFGYPDRAVAVRAMRGSASLAAKARFLMRRDQADTVVLKTFGVLPAARGTGLALAMGFRHYQYAVSRGYRFGINALMSEDNASRKMSTYIHGKPLRRYALYEL